MKNDEQLAKDRSEAYQSELRCIEQIKAGDFGPITSDDLVDLERRTLAAVDALHAKPY